jgi:hypothetical protein
MMDNTFLVEREQIVNNKSQVVLEQRVGEMVYLQQIVATRGYIMLKRGSVLDDPESLCTDK